MAGTEIVPVKLPNHRWDKWIMLPDGTVRRPIDDDDLAFWWLWGKKLLGWWQIADTRLPDGTRISTIFLGLDHSSGLDWDWSKCRTIDDNPELPIGYRPLVFETMIFGGDLDDYKARTVDCRLALANHEEAVRKAKGEGIYKCPRCGMISHNPNDAAHRYCGACCRFEGDPEGMVDGEEGD
jgi:hypothetical protein